MTDYSGIQLIALDLDETTLDGEGRLTQRTRQAILSAVNKGIHIVIASGRSYTALPGEVLSLEGIEYAITSNGAAIYSVKNNRCIHKCVIKQKSVENILLLRHKYNVTFEAFIDGIAYADAEYIRDPEKYGVIPAVKTYLKNTRRPVDDIAGFMLEHSNELESIDIVVPCIELRDSISAELSEADSEIYVTSSVKHMVEAAYKDAGKGSALKYLCSLLDIDLKRCAAFGNADNDTDMLKECGLGVAVANATESCLAAADLIAPAHTEDGVACIIEQITGVL